MHKYKYVTRDERRERARKKREKQELECRRLVNHLLLSGWITNVEWIGTQAGEDNVEIESDVWGKHEGDYHLISPCKKYTVRVTMKDATFWQKDPKWDKLIDKPISRFELTPKGVKVGILEINIQ